VPNAPKHQATAGKDMPFEEALQKLESVVEEMESGDLPLETLLSRFEEGTRLVKSCHARLSEAELKISQLEKNTNGDLVVKSASHTNTDDE
jgi:exodeoxyribonuclease VII small subunit